MTSMRPESATERARFGTVSNELSPSLLGKVFGLLAFSLLFAVVGGAVGYQVGRGAILPLFIVELGLIFAVQGLRDREPWNLILLYAFTFVSGMTIGPIIAVYTSAGAGATVLQAGAITGVMTIGLSAYALTTKRNLMALQPFLFMGLLGLLVAMVVNIFVGGTVMSTAIGWIGALLFSVMLVFDVNRTKHAQDTMGNAVVITLSVYLDIVNLFMFILRIMNGRR